MLLRGSSTPILGSFLPCHLDSPRHHHYHPELLSSPRNPDNSPGHLSWRLSINQSGLQNGIPPSSPRTPICRKVCKQKLRRAQSEGNLNDMVTAAWRSTNVCSPKKSIHVKDKVEKKTAKVRGHKRSMTIQEGLADSPKNYAKGQKGQNMVIEREIESVPSKMHLAKGLGAITGGGIGGGLDEFQRLGLGGDGNDHASVEEYYKKMVEENPGDSLYLRNYAQFLYQTKGDLEKADEFYSRAILADPSDGDLLSQYGKLTWELHRDQERASSYFERAVQVAPRDSHVLAAQAAFLWEADEEEEECPQTLPNNLLAIQAL